MLNITEIVEEIRTRLQTSKDLLWILSKEENADAALIEESLEKIKEIASVLDRYNTNAE